MGDRGIVMDPYPMDYVPDPPSVHRGATGTPAGTTPTPEPILPTTGNPGHVSGPRYTTPPVWFVPSCSSLEVIRAAAQRAADESGCDQLIQVDPSDPVNLEYCYPGRRL